MACQSDSKIKPKVYIGLNSKWQNPFSWLKKTPDRFKVTNKQEAYEKFERWVTGDLKIPGTIPPTEEEILRELTETELVCTCGPPKLCHGQVYLEILATKKLRPITTHYGKKNTTEFGFLRPGIYCDNCGDVFDQSGCVPFRKTDAYSEVLLCGRCRKKCLNDEILYVYLAEERVFARAREEKRQEQLKDKKNARRRQLRLVRSISAQSQTGNILR